MGKRLHKFVSCVLIPVSLVVTVQYRVRTHPYLVVQSVHAFNAQPQQILKFSLNCTNLSTLWVSCTKHVSCDISRRVISTASLWININISIFLSQDCGTPPLEVVPHPETTAGPEYGYEGRHAGLILGYVERSTFLASLRMLMSFSKVPLL